MKLSKIAYAALSLTGALSCGVAVAGNFQTVTTSVAREVIVGSAQTIVAPQVTYSFVAPVRNPTQNTYFQIQLDLTDGAQWVTGATTTGFAGAAAGNVALVDSVGIVVANAWGVVLDAAKPGRLYATFEIAPGVSVSDAKVIFNAGAAAGAAAALPVAANQLKIKNLTGLVGTLNLKADGTCDADIKNLTGEVFQYPNITDPTFKADDTNSASTASEHKLPNAQNKGPVISFPVNLLLAGTPDALLATQDYAAGAKKFKVTASTTASGLTANIGQVKYTKPSNGYDTNLVNVYGTPAATTPATAVSVSGSPELKDFSVTLTGTFASTAKFSLQAAACTDALGAAGVAPVGNTVTVKNAAALDLAVGTPLNVCYYVDGTSPIPTTGLPAALVLNKAPDNAGNVATRFEEQPNVCKSSFKVGSGINIDIRNYASFAKYPLGNYASYVRVINNSETATADIFAQMIYADGTYGPWGTLDSLAPRAVANYSNKFLESKLVNAAPTASPFAVGTAVYTSKQGAIASSTVTGGDGGPATGDRIRIVSTTGTTLRVQSFMLLPNQALLDTTNAQGIDFENTANNRTPPNALDAQPVSQDAINGLAK